jgi:asparagine synthetase B (glutamine-hydrolysing)
MCGIGCLLFECSSPCCIDSAGVSSWEQKLSAVLQRRGGDTPTRMFSFTTEFRRPKCVEDTTPAMIETKLLSSVLHLRGETIVPQPLQAHVDMKEMTTSGTVLRSLVLCWNGECYDLSTTDECVENVAKAAAADHLLQQNDTEILLGKLQRAIIDANVTKESQASWSSDLRRCISNVFSSIKGEYAFILSVLLKGGHNYTFFGRDQLGRRSLLIKRLQNIHQDHKLLMDPFTLMQPYHLDLSREVFILSSVAPNSTSGSATNANFSNNTNWVEIPPGRLFCIDVASGVLDSTDIPRQMTIGWDQTFHVSNIIISPTENTVLPIEGEISTTSQVMLKTACKLYHLLNAAVRRRVLHVPQRKVYDTEHATNVQTTHASVGILFSGGLDSVVLAALCHNHVPPNEPIDLINVAFYDDTDSQNVTNEVPISSAVPDRTAALASFYEMTTRFATRKFNFIAVDVTYSEVMVERQRILTLIKPLSTHMDFNIGSAMWFASRGLGRCVLPIPKWETLSTPHSMQSSERPFNVSVSCNLSQNSSKPSSKKVACINSQCLRRAHSACVFQSCTVCCSSYRKKISSFLGGSATGVCQAHSFSRELFPKSSSDPDKRNDSDKGSVTPEKILPFPHLSDAYVISGAKVLIVGIGADEQMAGYGRHRAVYKRGGYRALRIELDMEMDRLWQRNLGRDDRCISDHGRETRFPFLDEDLVSFLASESLESICDLDQREGVGDKMILRLVARMIGVKKCSGLVKRAIQFGSRIAKISEANCFASRRKASGTAMVVND